MEHQEPKLVQGRIPAGKACPFTEQCSSPTNGTCGHKGVEHAVPYSCGYARMFNIMGTEGK